MTTEATVPAGRARARATITQKAPGVIFGLDVAEAVFRRARPGRRGRARARRACGARRAAGPARRGHARARCSTGERTALNFLAAPVGRRDADRAGRAGGRERRRHGAILDTRKTTPGLRALEKAAVAAGGGTNHRAGLFDAILIKENHVARRAAGWGRRCAARARRGRTCRVEVEVRDAAEIDEALEAGADAAAARQHDARSECAAAVARVARPRASSRRQRRHHARDGSGLCDHRGARLRLARGAHPLGPGARPLPPPGASMNLPMTALLEPSTNIPALQDEVRALAARARRRHPRAQLPAARDPGRRRLRRRLARPLAAGRARPTPR